MDRDFHKTAMDFLELAGFLFLAGVGHLIVKEWGRQPQRDPPPSKEVACAILELLLGFKKTGNLQLKSGFVDQVRFLKELLPGFV